MSHELARQLLNHRDNDVRIEVLLYNDPNGEIYETRLIALICDDDLADPDLRLTPAVDYSPTADAVVIRTGVIVTFDPRSLS